MTDYEQWQDALAERFPASDIEQPFDIAKPIFDAYATGQIPAMRIYLRGTSESPRKYLGASGLGQKCARKAWANYRGLGGDFEGRLVRLFRTGDVYEERMRAELEAIGFECAGDQSRFTAFADRVGGHTDGFVRLGELPWALWEAKTANHRRTTELKKLLREDGYRALKKWDAKYWYQIHIYMKAFGLNVCLYEVTDKNTDDVVAFLVPLDEEAVGEAGARALEILESVGPAPRAFTRPATPDCTRFCDFEAWCWHGDDLPRVCGTCTSWRDGLCTRNGSPAVEVCDQYEQVPRDEESVVGEWEAL